MKYLKNNRWIFGLILILTIVSGWIVFDYRNQKEPIKKDVAGIAQQKSSTDADNPKTDATKTLECYNSVPEQQSISELIENLSIFYLNFSLLTRTYYGSV